MAIKIRKTKRNPCPGKSYKRYANLGTSAKTRPAKKLRLFFKIAAYAIVITALIYCYKFTVSYLYACEKLFINEIEVVGCNNVTATEIKKLIPFKVGDNILKVNLSQTEKDLRQFKPELKDISMTRIWKQKKILISLKEREPEVFILQDGRLAGLDFDNTPFTLRGGMFDMKIPVLQYQDEKARRDLLNFLKAFKPYAPDFIQRITEIKYGETEDIVFVIDNKINVFWGSPKENAIEDKIKKFKAVFADSSGRYQNLDYIDLTFLDDGKNKVVVKPSAETGGKQV